MRRFQAMRYAVGCALMFGASVVYAAPCSYYSSPTPSTLNTSNVTINSAFATDCAGHYSASPPPASLANLTAFINGSGSGLPLFGVNNWTDILQVNDQSQSLGTGFAGLNFGITGLSFGPSDLSFTLLVTDANGNTQPNLPVTMDLVVGLKASNDFDFYRFNPLVLNASNGGSYDVAITNGNGNGGGDGNAQDLSNLYLFGRNVQGCTVDCGGVPPTGNPVPEPGSLALAVLALAGLGVARRRR